MGQKLVLKYINKTVHPTHFKTTSSYLSNMLMWNSSPLLPQNWPFMVMQQN